MPVGRKSASPCTITSRVRAVRCAARHELVALDAMIAPTRDPQAAGVWHDRGRAFADAADHRQRAGQFAVPGLQRMRAGAAVLVEVAVVAARHDVQQPARRAGIRIVVDGEDAAVRHDANAERIPDAAGESLQVLAVGRHAIEAVLAAGVGDHRAVGADRVDTAMPWFSPRPMMSEPSASLGDAAQAVVRIVVLGFQTQQLLLLVGHAVVVRIAEQERRCAAVTTYTAPSARTSRFIAWRKPSANVLQWSSWPSPSESDSMRMRSLAGPL